MAEVVYQFTKHGDHEPAARELLQRFVGEDGLTEAHVHSAAGVVTIVLVNDPQPDLVKEFESQGWNRGDVWRRR